MSRKRYDREFKMSAVKLVTEQGYTVAQAAKSLGVTAQALRGWRERLAPASPTGSPATEGQAGEVNLREENRRLRKENERLRMEREILKKATAFFAREQP